MRWRERRAWDSYMEGVVNHANGSGVDPGMTEGCPECDDFREQGYRDAELRRVLRRYEFTREKVRTRIEVREAGGARMTRVIEDEADQLERDRGRLRS